MKSRNQTELLATLCALVVTLSGPLPGEEFVYNMDAFEVSTVLSFSDEPALGLSTPATLLRYATGVDLQARGYPELQSDLTVRGSTFEQTGVRIGGVPLFDPQTGHYSMEIPFSSEMLTGPQLATGVENALVGFNSNVATVIYGWAPVLQRGSVEVGFGSDELRFGQFYVGELVGDGGWAADVSAGHSQGKGTEAYGDFQVHRVAARLQYQGRGFQADFVAGYLDKFYGWPNMYTGGVFGFRPETEDYQNRLFAANFQWHYGQGSYFQAGLSHREMDDDYTFDRIALPDLQFEHLTRTRALSFDGRHVLSENWMLLHNLSYLGDELVRSTSLTNGDPVTGNDFRERNYLKGAATLRKIWTAHQGQIITIDVGLHGFGTSEDAGRLVPLFRLESSTTLGSGELVSFVEYAGSTQVPGYTALRSRPGLFGGNPNLGAEETGVWEVGAAFRRDQWSVNLVVFEREDERLVDWVYTLGSPNARSAQAVDLETKGFEMAVSYAARRVNFRVSYAWLEKRADYHAATPTGSFYILNFPVHRFTAGLDWNIVEGVQLSGEIEYRAAEDNALRLTGDESLFGSFALRWRAPWDKDLEFSLLVDNVFDDDFEELPGTPAVGRHGSLRMRYQW